jgi:hypothetical protein
VRHEWKKRFLAQVHRPCHENTTVTMLSVDSVGLQYDLTDAFLTGAKYAMIRLFGSYVFDQSRQCGYIADCCVLH